MAKINNKSALEWFVSENQCTKEGNEIFWWETSR